jgi:hypothetical protein
LDSLAPPAHLGASPLRRFVAQIQAQAAHASSISPYARASLHTLRAAGTTAIVGGALGALDGTWGLDFHGYPVDGLLALAGAGASLWLAADPDGLGVEARTTMSVAGGIFAYRKMRAWAGARTKSSDSASENPSDDPILAAAARLDS